MSNADYNTLEARIDWLTATQKPRMGGSSLRAIARYGIREEQELGNELKEYHAGGYHGEMCGHWRWGTREDGSIIVVSGAQAQTWAPSIATICDHISRVDYCVTAVDQTQGHNPVRELRERVEGGQARPSLAKRSGYQIEYRRGETFTVGARSSDYYARIYNKHKESEGAYPPGAWRWELECKHRVTDYERERIREGRTEPNQVAALLANHFQRYEIFTPFSQGAASDRYYRVREEIDADKSLIWLQQQVSQRVQWLIRERGRDAVLRALGLGEIKPTREQA